MAEENAYLEPGPLVLHVLENSAYGSISSSSIEAHNEATTDYGFGLPNDSTSSYAVQMVASNYQFSNDSDASNIYLDMPSKPLQIDGKFPFLHRKLYNYNNEEEKLIATWYIR